VKIHVAIVSDETLANLIPILMERLDKVYLVCSETTKSRGLDGRIEGLLGQEGMGVETKFGSPNAGLKSIHDYARALAAQIQGPPRRGDCSQRHGWNQAYAAWVCRSVPGHRTEYPLYRYLSPAH
jgi:hypothetical protein